MYVAYMDKNINMAWDDACQIYMLIYTVKSIH